MISTGREQGTTAARRIGYWSALAALATAAGFSMGIPVPFVLTMVALHHCV